MRTTVIVFQILIAILLVYPQRKDTVKIIAVGDIMLGTTYPDSSFLPHNSFDLFSPLMPYMNDADVRFGNLEGVLTDDLSQVKACKSEGRCYFFSMPTYYAKSLKQAKFDCLCLANNHLNDFGRVGRRSTKRCLRNVGIRFAGLAECPLDTFTRNGVKFGFCAFSPNAGMASIKDLQRAKSYVKYLNSITDIVVVSFHAGAESGNNFHVTRHKEFYIGEDRGNVYEFCHAMIDAGADLLIGHGPHITRAVEVYKKRFIAYSLGNFCTYSKISVAGLNGIAPMIKIYTDSKGQLLKAQIIPIKQTKFKAPKIDNAKKAICQIRYLTKTDFPEMDNVINISDDGWINYCTFTIK
jgi:hypothetical protein